MYRYKKLLISVHIKQGCEREFLQGQKKNFGSYWHVHKSSSGGYSYAIDKLIDLNLMVLVPHSASGLMLG